MRFASGRAAATVVLGATLVVAVACSKATTGRGTPPQEAGREALRLLADAGESLGIDFQGATDEERTRRLERLAAVLPPELDDGRLWTIVCTARTERLLAAALLATRSRDDAARRVEAELANASPRVDAAIAGFLLFHAAPTLEKALDSARRYLGGAGPAQRRVGHMIATLTTLEARGPNPFEFGPDSGAIDIASETWPADRLRPLPLPDLVHRACVWNDRTQGSGGTAVHAVRLRQRIAELLEPKDAPPSTTIVDFARMDAAAARRILPCLHFKDLKALHPLSEIAFVRREAVR